MPTFYYKAIAGDEEVTCKVCGGSGKYYHPPVYGDDSEYKCQYCKGAGKVSRIIDIKLKLEHGDYDLHGSDILYLLGKVEQESQ